jgi:2'-5' RNA ligase
VAVDPPAEVCAELAAWARAALGGVGAGDPDRRERRSPAKVRVLGAETMHVTLCFLGGRPIGEVETIAAALAAPPAQSVELHVGAPLWLPPRRPRALALELHDRTGALTEMHASVRDALAGVIDWQPERRRFRPHVTVARIGRGGDRRARAAGRRRGRSGDDGAPSHDLVLAPSPQLSFAVGELVLYRSLLSREGARYEAIATRALVESNDDSELSSSPPSPGSSPGAGVGFTSGGGHEGGAPSMPGAARKPPSHSGGEPSSQA